MHSKPAHISQYLEREADNHENREAPCSVAPKLAEVDYNQCGEKGTEEGISP